MRIIYYLFLKILKFPVRLFSDIHYSAIIKHSKLEKPVAIEKGTRVYNSYIGRFSYVGKESTIVSTQIGNFCSIADNCITSPAMHPTHMVSSSPIFYTKKNIFRKSYNIVDFMEYKATRIGNDVWIGTHVVIKGGVEIGDGAIIGAYSIVTKNVEPYSIVAGNPAKEIRKRFPPEVIKKLLSIKWWNWSEHDLKKYGRLFSNPNEFIDKMAIK